MKTKSNPEVFGGQSGYNHRFFHGFKPEDFIGRMTTVCAAGNNSNVDFIALKRFYLACLDFNYICLFFYLPTEDHINVFGENDVYHLVALAQSQVKAKKPHGIEPMERR